jgi:hypothetical protein
MLRSQKHFLARAYEGTNEGAEIANWKIAKSHPLKPLLQKLPQWFFYSGECKELASVPLTSKGGTVLTTGTTKGAGKKKAAKGKVEGNTNFLGTLSAPDTKKILASCSPSSFGKGSETVYDESVRKGKEIKAEMLSLGDSKSIKQSWKSKRYVKESVFTPMINVINDKILKKLPTDFLGKSSEIDVQFYKLAIYESGGHFHKHRDTVHSPDHKATLLIEVKSEHEGGDFIIEKNDVKRVWRLTNKQDDERTDVPEDLLFTFSASDDDTLAAIGEKRKSSIVSAVKAQKKSKPAVKLDDEDEAGGEEDEEKYSVEENEDEVDEGDEDDEDDEKVEDDEDEKNEKSGIKWCIFYTDVEHQVEPVLKGVRMVLQFDVYCKASQTDTSDESDKGEVDGSDDQYDEEDDEDKSRDEDEQDDDEDEDDREDTSCDIFELSKEKCLHEIDEDATASFKKSVLQEIGKCLTKYVTKDKCIAIPLYYLYTLQSIDYESLKNLDRELFDFLLDEGFSIGLSPIELKAYTDYEDGCFSGEGSDYTLNLHDFPIKIYQKKKTVTDEMKGNDNAERESTFKLLPKWPKSVSLTYIHSGMESSFLCDQTSHCEYTGNEAQQGSNHYLCGTMIIFQKKNNSNK